LKATLVGGIALLAAALALPALAQSTLNNSGGAGMIGAGGVGALSGDGAGMIGRPSARAGITGSDVVQLPSNQPHDSAPPPPVGAGYGTPGNAGNLGAASNSGVGAGVESDIRSGIATTPNMR
jgi:hypothetical protein